MKPLLFGMISVFLLFSPAMGETLRLVSLESPPAEYTENGRVTGRNVDIVTEALKRMGHDCTISLLPWQRAVRMTKTGEADGLIDAAYNSDRAVFFHYPAEEIYIEKWYAFQLKTSDLTLDRDLRNAHQISIGASRGFEYGGVLQDAIDNNRFREIQETSGNKFNLHKLIGKRFDMFVGVKLTILYMAAQMGYRDQIRIVPMTETGEPYLLSASRTYLAFSKKTVPRRTADRFSRVIAEMKQAGIFREIDARYQ